MKPPRRTPEQPRHTPGPWRVSGFEPKVDAPNRVVMGSDDFSVCHVGERDKEENIANARLIAAAPELLEACRKAVYELNTIRARDGVPYNYAGYKSDVDEDYFSSVVDECFAAINKAEGRP